MCKVISVSATKGGVTKTTICRNLSYQLAKEGKKVLVIDCDPQGSLTSIFGILELGEKLTLSKLMMRVMEDENLPNKEEYLITVDNVDIIASNEHLFVTEVQLTNEMSKEYILREILDVLRNDYDYILLDCSPSVGNITINALATSDSVIIPVTPEYLSAKGVEIILKTIFRVKKRINKTLEIDGIILSMFDDRLLLTKEIKDMIKEAYGKHLNIFKTSISKSTKVGQANLVGKSIIEYDDNNKVSKSFIELTKEVLSIG